MLHGVTSYIILRELIPEKRRKKGEIEIQ